MNNLVIASILTKPKDYKQTIKTCCPKSMDKWREDKGRGKSDHKNCDVEIPEIPDSWEQLNRQLKGDSKLLSKFPKVKSANS